MEYLTYKYNNDKDELSVHFYPSSKRVAISRYAGSAECTYNPKYKHLAAYAALKGTTLDPWTFLKQEFAEGRAEEFSEWVLHNVPVGYIDGDYFVFD